MDQKNKIMKKFKVNINNEVFEYEENTSYFDIVTEDLFLAVFVLVVGLLVVVL